jgi:uncharacterized protein YggT (Ycf19 family)
MRNRTLIQVAQRREASSQELQSQLALELILNVYAVVGSLILIRCLLLWLKVDDRIWIGRTVYKLSGPFAKPFTWLPGSALTIVGDLTVGDFTLLAIVIMFPLGVYAYGTRRRNTT